MNDSDRLPSRRGEASSNPASGVDWRDAEQQIENTLFALLLEGKAQTLHEAEEMYLDASLSEVSRLAGSDLSNEALSSHPLILMLVSHGSRGWEDSLL